MEWRRETDLDGKYAQRRIGAYTTDWGLKCLKLS